MGKLYILIAILGWAFWAFACKIVATKLNPLYMTLSSYTIGFCCVPIYLLLLKHDKHVQFNWPGFAWAIAGGASGVSAYLAYVYALKTYDAGTASILVSSTYPTLTFILAVLFLGETLTLSKMIGIGLVMIGVIVLGH
jgi:drug/metabolite transporter (DMT)-like permease